MLKRNGEKEIGSVRDDDDWEQLFQKQWKATCSSNWREFGWMDFSTPAQKKHQNIGTGSWRLCGNLEANPYHHHYLFWACPKIIPFWQEIHKCLENVFGTQILLEFLYVNSKHFYICRQMLN